MEKVKAKAEKMKATLNGVLNILVSLTLILIASPIPAKHKKRESYASNEITSSRETCTLNTQTSIQRFSILWSQTTSFALSLGGSMR